MLLLFYLSVLWEDQCEQSPAVQGEVSEKNVLQEGRESTGQCWDPTELYQGGRSLSKLNFVTLGQGEGDSQGWSRSSS